MKKYTPPPRHPVIQRMLDAQHALPWDWPDEDDERYCLSHSVAAEIEEMGLAGFIAFLFLETKSSVGRSLFFSSPKLWKNERFPVFVEVIEMIREDDLACYHFFPMLANDFGINTGTLAKTMDIGYGCRYAKTPLSNVEIELLLERIPADRIEKIKTEGAPVFSLNPG